MKQVSLSPSLQFTEVGMYHYTECGLKDVWLLNGFKELNTPYGKAVSVERAEQLDEAIAGVLVDKPRKLKGSEFRFLRKQLGQSQVSMAQAWGVSHETVAKWERTGNLPAMADRFIRAYWREVREGNAHIVELLDRLAKADTVLNNHAGQEKIVLKETRTGWRAAA